LLGLEGIGGGTLEILALIPDIKFI